MPASTTDSSIHNGLPISAVVLSRNNLKTLPAVLAALRVPQLANGAGIAEIIVVDMASTDGSREWLEARDDIRLLRVPRHSFARAANMGVRAAAARRTLLVCADTVPENGQGPSDWLALLALSLEQMEGTGIAGGRIITPTGRILSEGRSFISGTGINPWLSSIAAGNEDGPAEEIRLEVDGVDGRLMLFDRVLFDAVGGFDEAYQPQGAVVDDFCFGARVHGWRIGVCPAARGVCYEPTAYPSLSAENNAPAAALQKKDNIDEAILREHAGIWEEKWGINPLFVDLTRLRQLYGHTRVCWKLNEHQRFMPLRWPVAVDMCMVTWNSAGHLERCLESLAQTEYPAELLTLFVVDNGSTDSTMDVVAEWSGKLPFEVRLHHLDVNTGAVPAMNLAMGMGAAEIIVKMDDDIRVSPDWLNRLTGRFLQRPYAGVVGAKILDDTPEGVIQCGPVYQPPFYNDEEGQADEGQVDQVERCLHVRGCCCLYRRDALRRVGPMDVRYSPSQFDDIDHHIAFWNAGFEVIYDGSTAVWHKRSTGGFLSRSVWGSAHNNSNKFYAKWSQRAINALDIALNISSEGRVLRARPLAELLPEFPAPKAGAPDAAAPKAGAPDAAASKAAAPDAVASDAGALKAPAAKAPSSDAGATKAPADSPAIFPRAAHQAAKRAEPICRAFSEMREQTLQPLADLGAVYLHLTRQREAEGNTGLAFGAAASGLAFAPTYGPLLMEFALIARKLGNHALADAAFRRAKSLGARLVPAQETVTARLVTPVAAQSSNGPLAHKRVLVGCLPDSGLFGQGSAFVRQCANVLREAGAEVTEWSGHTADLEAPDGGRYDVVHLLGLEPAFRSSTCVQAARTLNPGGRVIFTPLLVDRGRVEWANTVLPRLFREGMAQRDLENRLAQLAATPDLYGISRQNAASEAHWGHRELVAAALRAAHTVTHVDALEQRELRNMGAAGASGMAGTAPAAFLPALFPAFFSGGAASGQPAGTVLPASSVDFGDSPFVLALGTLAPSDNMLMLCTAAQAARLRVVHLGMQPEPGYLSLCRKLAPNGLFLPVVDEAVVAAALERAAVYAAPGFVRSWPLYGLAAAMLERPVLLAEGQPESAVLGAHAFMADPYDIQSLVGALAAAVAESGGSQRLVEAKSAALKAAGPDAFARYLLALYAE